MDIVDTESRQRRQTTVLNREVTKRVGLNDMYLEYSRCWNLVMVVDTIFDSLFPFNY